MVDMQLIKLVIILLISSPFSSSETIDQWEDQYEDCPAWADGFQCEKNPKFMLRKCIESCYLHDTIHQAVLSGIPSTVTCDSSIGQFIIEVHPNWAPWGANRFLKLASDGFFDHSFLNRTQNLIHFSENPILMNKELAFKWKSIQPIPDDNIKLKPLVKGFKHGMLSFSKNKNEIGRSTNIFLTVSDDDSLGSNTNSWETPIGVIIEGLPILRTIKNSISYQRRNSIPNKVNSPSSLSIPSIPSILKCNVNLPLEKEEQEKTDLELITRSSKINPNSKAKNPDELEAIARTERRKRIRRAARIRERSESHAKAKREGSGDDFIGP